MIDKTNLTLYATGAADSNWDLYQNEQGYLYAIARPGTGAEDSCWGHPSHLKRLDRLGIRHGFTVVKEER